MAKANLLIAEDDPMLREIYVKKFSMLGYDIRTAENGQVTIEEIEKQPPDILILDINMPEVDGFGVLEKFPRDKRAFPIILLTNFTDDACKKRGDELGADDYFVKGEMTIKKLTGMVETLLKMKGYWSKG